MSGPGLSALRDWPCSLRTLSSSFKGDFSVLKKATVQVHGFSPLNMLHLQLLWLWGIISSFTCQLNTHGKRNSSRRNSLHPIGLWACWWPVFLILIWCESAQPIVGLNRWTWAVEEKCLSMSLEIRESEVLLHHLCFGSCLKVPYLGFPQWWTAVYKPNGPFLPHVVFGKHVITLTEKWTRRAQDLNFGSAPHFRSIPVQPLPSALG